MAVSYYALLIIGVSLVVFLCLWFQHIMPNMVEKAIKEFKEAHKKLTEKKNKVESTKSTVDVTPLKPDQIQKHSPSPSTDTPVFYINLDTAYDRRKHIINQFQKHTFTNTYRVHAVDVKQLVSTKKGRIEMIQDENHENHEIMFVNHYDNHTPVELACTLSHIKAIMNAYEMKYDHVLVVEDDVSFDLKPFWNNTLNNVVKDAPKDWDIINIYTKDQLNTSETYVMAPEAIGCVSYIISRRGMKQIIDELIMKEDDKWILRFDKKMIKIEHIVADSIIFRLVENYFQYNPSLTVTLNDTDKMQSQLHTRHTLQHIKTSTKILNSYLNK